MGNHTAIANFSEVSGAAHQVGLLADAMPSPADQSLSDRVMGATVHAFTSISASWDLIEKLVGSVQGLGKLLLTATGGKFAAKVGSYQITAASVQALVRELKWFGIIGLAFNLKSSCKTVAEFLESVKHDSRVEACKAALPLALSLGGVSASSISVADFIGGEFFDKGLGWAGAVLVPLAIGLSSLAVVANAIGAKKSRDLSQRLKKLDKRDLELAKKLLAEVQPSEDEKMAALANRAVSPGSPLAKEIEERLAEKKRSAFKSASSSSSLKSIEKLEKITDPKELAKEAQQVLERVKVVAERRFASKLAAVGLKLISITGLTLLLNPATVLAGSILLGGGAALSFGKVLYDKYAIDRGLKPVDSGEAGVMHVEADNPGAVE